MSEKERELTIKVTHSELRALLTAVTHLPIEVSFPLKQKLRQQYTENFTSEK